MSKKINIKYECVCSFPVPTDEFNISMFWKMSRNYVCTVFIWMVISTCARCYNWRSSNVLQWRVWRLVACEPC